MSNQYGLKEVMNLQFMQYTDKSPLCYTDFCEMTEVDNTGTRLDIFGGQGNYKLMSFDHTKLSTLKVKFPLVDISLLALMMGDTLATGAKNVYEREVKVIDAAAYTVTLDQTPLANTVPAVYFLTGTRDNGTPLTKVASAPTTGQYSITGNTLTFASADASKSVVVWYQYATPTTTSSFSMKANKFVSDMFIVGDGLATDQVTSSVKSTKVTIYRAKFKPNFNLSMSSTQATTIDAELDMYAEKVGNDYVYYDVNILT